MTGSRILELPALGSKDFLSILNLSPDVLEQALALAAVFKSERMRAGRTPTY